MGHKPELVDFECVVDHAGLYVWENYEACLTIVFNKYADGDVVIGEHNFPFLSENHPEESQRLEMAEVSVKLLKQSQSRDE